MAVIEQEPQVQPLAEPFSVPVDEVRQVFWDAADLIEEKGWIRGRAKTQYGFCIMGALFETISGPAAMNHGSRKVKLWEKVRDRSYAAFDSWNYDSVFWNDFVAQNKEEVVAKLREIADT